MKFYIIIPAHNESKTIRFTLKSLVNQTLLPKKIVVVNDNSGDDTEKIVSKFCNKYKWIKIVNKASSPKHTPGEKIINAFYEGYTSLDDQYDVICKFDADLIFDSNYIKKISQHFQGNDRLGIVGGICYLKKEGRWVPENKYGHDHIRGAIKSYRKDCFVEIGKIKKSIGWDTIDEFLAKYYSWDILVDAELKVKHLRQTGERYDSESEKLQGVACYKMRLGVILTLLSGIKSAINKGSFSTIKSYLTGYFIAKSKKMSFLVDQKQGRFIKKRRWKGIFKSFFKSGPLSFFDKKQFKDEHINIRRRR